MAAATPNRLELDLSGLMCDMKFALLMETQKLNEATRAAGIDISEHLETVFGDFFELINEYSEELKEVIEDACKAESVELVDEKVDATVIPNDWMEGGLVTCKKCLLQWDGHAQHNCY